MILANTHLKFPVGGGSSPSRVMGKKRIKADRKKIVNKSLVATVSTPFTYPVYSIIQP
jgi:hypothetical protein